MADNTNPAAANPLGANAGGLPNQQGTGLPPPPPPPPPIMDPAAAGMGYDPATMGPPPGYGYPPQQGYGYPPAGGQQQPPYGYAPPPPGYGYPPQQGYGYPPAGGQQQPPYGYAPPPPGYGYPPAGYPPPAPVDEGPVVPIGSFGNDEKSFITTIKIPAHSLTFDENKFLSLLAGSISLTKDEKKRIIEAVPKLSQYQIDELIKILEEEKRKFSELDVKHREQLQTLEGKHADEWKSLEMEMAAPEKQREEEDQAAKLRASLGIPANDNSAEGGKEQKKAA